MKKEISERCKKCDGNEMCVHYRRLKKLISDTRKENFVEKLKKEKKNFMFQISL